MSQEKSFQCYHFLCYKTTADITVRHNGELALCTASLLPKFQPAPCFLSAIIGQID